MVRPQPRSRTPSLVIILYSGTDHTDASGAEYAQLHITLTLANAIVMTDIEHEVTPTDEQRDAVSDAQLFGVNLEG